eukprot:1370069-Pyramimonas_sp.AAC.1
MARGSAKAKAKATTSAPPPPAEVASAESNGINKEFLAEMSSLYEKICNHEVFRDLRDAGALGIVEAADGGEENIETPPKRARKELKHPEMSEQKNIHGMQAAFDLNEYQTAMKLHGTYRCAGNEFWLDFWFTSQPGVPYNKTSIYQLADKSFSEPN